MLRDKDDISLLLGAVAVAGIGSKPTIVGTSLLYTKLKSDKYLFMIYISRIRGRMIAKKKKIQTVETSEC